MDNIKDEANIDEKENEQNIKNDCNCGCENCGEEGCSEEDCKNVIKTVTVRKKR